jgi:hypothetical protein
VHDSCRQQCTCNQQITEMHVGGERYQNGPFLLCAERDSPTLTGFSCACNATALASQQQQQQWLCAVFWKAQTVSVAVLLCLRYLCTAAALLLLLVALWLWNCCSRALCVCVYIKHTLHIGADRVRQVGTAHASQGLQYCCLSR